MTNSNTAVQNSMTDLKQVGSYIATVAQSKSLTMRKIAQDTKLSVNSVNVVLRGEPGNIKTYEVVCQYLGFSFCKAVVDALNPVVPAKQACCEATATK